MVSYVENNSTFWKTVSKTVLGWEWYLQSAECEFVLFSTLKSKQP